MRWLVGCLCCWLSVTTLWADTDSDKLDKVIAVVNEGVVTERELDERIAAVKQRFVGTDMELPADEILRKQILQQLIDIDLQLQLAKRASFSIDDHELERAIDNIARHHHLTVEQLREEVVENGLSYVSYRENIRRELTINQIQQQAIAPNVVVTDQQIEDYLAVYQEQAKLNQEYHVKNILVSLPESPSPAQVNRAGQKAKEILAMINKGEEFSDVALRESGGRTALQGGDLGWRQLASLPEIFAEKVVDMQPGDIAGPLQAANGFHLIQLVAVRGHPTEQMDITLTHVRHILIQPDQHLSANEARKRLSELRTAILEGADFAKLAEKHSMDPGSADKGGDLGWVKTQDLVPSFTEAMDVLEPGQLSQPIQTQFGFHLIEVLGRKTLDNTEEQLRSQTREFIFQRKFAEAVDNWLQELRAQSFIRILDESLRDEDEDNEDE